MSRLAPAFGLGLGLAFALPVSSPAKPVEGKDHAPRSRGGETLFSPVSPAVSGITLVNTYDDPEMWTSRFREFTLGAIGTGVGIADVDTDGRPDLLLVTKMGGLHYYRNEGNWHFSDRTAAAGLALPAVGWYQGVAVADVNRDGRPDIHVCRFGQPNQLFMQQADGTFRDEAAERGLAVVDASGQAFFADYDGDGWLDLYLQTNLLNAETRPNGQPDRLLRNSGDGRFVDVTETARIRGETQGHSATWWDYDEDGRPDLYVANDFRDPDSLWRNRGDGTFSQELSRVVPLTPHSSMGADVGDLNNDGHLDLMVADMAATSHEKDHRGMARVRAGLPDTDAQPQVAPQYMRNAVFLNTGAGRMEEVAWLTGLEATDWTWTVRLEDFDENGWVDVFVSNGMVRELHNADLVKRMTALESLLERTRIMTDSPMLREHNLAFANCGQLAFTPAGRAWGLDLEDVNCGSATGDLDGDGDLDLVLATLDGPFVLYRNDSQGRSLTVELHAVASAPDGVGAVLRLETPQGTQTREILPGRGYLSSHQPIAHFGLPAGEAGRLSITWPGGRVQQVEGLYPGKHYRIREDTATSVRAATEVPPAFLQALPESLGLSVATKSRAVNELHRQPLLLLRQNRIGPALTAADLDGDGAEDVLVGGATGEPARLLSKLGTAYLPLGLKGVEAGADLADGPLLAFDADGDGDLDLLCTKGGNAPESARSTYQPRLHLNQGGGQFLAEPAAWPAGKIVVGATAVADWDGDGDLDVFLGARPLPGTWPRPQPSRLFRNDGGRFTDVTGDFAPGLLQAGCVQSAVWTDLDRDGRPDLLIAGEGTPVRAFLNEQGRLVERTGALGFGTAGEGHWLSLLAADLNGDGRPDVVAGNLGLNTPFRASSARPWLTWAGVQEPGGRPHLLDSKWENATLYPLRGYAHLTAAFPSLARRFPTHDAFARATLDELLPPEQRGEPALRITELASGVFLSQPGGAWAFLPFERAAQIAPLQGTVALDVNSDGLLDLLGAGNSFAPLPEIGRFAGGVGLVLAGDGRGGFTKLPPARSGMLLPGDGRALVLADLGPEGQPTVIASRHHDRLQGWSLSSRNVGVRLAGRAANPTAVGAWVEAEWADGTRQGQEVRLGQGALTQNTPTLFFGLRDGRPPARVRVSWPSGPTVEYAWPVDGTPLLLLRSP